jgi:hypothetical protein
MKRTLLLLVSLLIPCPVQAEVCQVDNALVTAVYQWDDGSIFIHVDRAVGCGCAEDFRAAFHKNDNERFFLAAALTALTAGKKVFMRADNVNGTCPVHANTPKLLALVIKSN